MSTPKASQTIRLSDTIDQYARRVHINVRSGKVTMVYRWKDSKSTKAHTQRITLDDAQTANLTGLLVKAAAKSMSGDVRDEARENAFAAKMLKTIESDVFED